MQETKLIKCTVCTARLTEKDDFKVSYGPNMSRDRMYVRVCRHAIARGKEGCLNTKPPEDLDKAVKEENYG